MIPENDPVEQQKRLPYNDLVGACVIVQNAVDMSRTFRELEGGAERSPAIGSRLLQSMWDSHLKRFGEYRLDLQKPPDSWRRNRFSETHYESASKRCGRGVTISGTLQSGVSGVLSSDNEF